MTLVLGTRAVNRLMFARSATAGDPSRADSSIVTIVRRPVVTTYVILRFVGVGIKSFRGPLIDQP